MQIKKISPKELGHETRAHYYFRVNDNGDNEEKKELANGIPADGIPTPISNKLFYYDEEFDDYGQPIEKSLCLMLSNIHTNDIVVIENIWAITLSRNFVVGLLQVFIEKSIKLYIIDYDKSDYIEIDVPRLLDMLESRTGINCDIKRYQEVMKDYSNMYCGGKLI